MSCFFLCLGLNDTSDDLKDEEIIYDDITLLPRTMFYRYYLKNEIVSILHNIPHIVKATLHISQDDPKRRYVLHLVLSKMWKYDDSLDSNISRTSSFNELDDIPRLIISPSEEERNKLKNELFMNLDFRTFINVYFLDKYPTVENEYSSDYMLNTLLTREIVGHNNEVKKIPLIQIEYVYRPEDASRDF
jgi:hypothetical protein